MTVSLANFALNKPIVGTTDATADTLYTASNGAGQINNATAYNSDGSAVKLSLYVLPPGVAADAVDPTWEQEIPAGRSVILPGLLGHTVPANGTIQAFAGTTAVVSVTISGATIL